MGMLISPQKEIEAIRFVPFRSQARRVEKVICVDAVIMARIDARTVATNRVKNYAYSPTKSMNNVVEGLFKLGMISKGAMEAHVALCNERAAKRERVYAADDIVDRAKTLGLKFTAAQMRKIKAVKP